MVQFTQAVVDEIAALAQARGLEPASALAVVEVESAGRAFEADGATPVFLFEKHVFYRQLRDGAPALLAGAEAAGLAVPAWQKGAQYADQKGAARLGLLQRARAVDEELANRSASWGLGQIMGYHAVTLGYGSATQMVAEMAQGGISAQVEAMLRFIMADAGMVQALINRDWAGFARRYNGKQYAVLRYDAKLANAHGAWAARLRKPGASTPVAPSANARGRQEMSHLQAHLARLGYPVGKIDGLFGPMTSNALFAFQYQNGLPTTGQPDNATLMALPGGLPMPVGEERARAGKAELIRDGVGAVIAADRNGKAAIGVGLAGLLGGLGALPNVGPAVSGFADALFGLPQGQGSAVDSVPGLIGAILPFLGAGGAVPVAALGAGLFLLRSIAGIADARVADHREGFERNSPSRAVMSPVERWRS